jgi:2,4-dienoyl-CoA reductase-like NADH-dependent reductase (Old Yellow Enzyme family)
MNYPSLFLPLKVAPYQLKHRLALAPLTQYDRKTFYGGDIAGYTDYLAHDELAQA